MPLELPNLDDRGYADLLAEARRLIPVYDPKWTNHNPADPGIALLELFAYLTEMLLYRLDRVTAENKRKFLKLLNGPEWKPGADLTADIRSTVLAVRTRERAVTVADFERLSTEGFNEWLATLQRTEQDGRPLDEWWRVTQLDAAGPDLPSTVRSVARVACVASRNLERGTEDERKAYAPAHVSLSVVPQESVGLQPSPAQKAALWGYLDERRTLTTRHHVVGPYYTPIRAEVVIASAGGAAIDSMTTRVVGRLASFLDRFTGGARERGWSFGRDVYASELYEQIESVEGVDYIIDLMLFSNCGTGDAQCVEAPPMWHTEGDLVGMALAPHHLPLFGGGGIVIAPNTDILPVQLTVTLTHPGTANPPTLKRLAKAAVRRFFHPLHDGPGPGTTTDTDVMLAELKTVLDDLPDVSAVALALQTDTTRLLTAGEQIVGVHVETGELVNWQVHVTVVEA